MAGAHTVLDRRPPLFPPHVDRKRQGRAILLGKMRRRLHRTPGDRHRTAHHGCGYRRPARVIRLRHPIRPACMSIATRGISIPFLARKMRALRGFKPALTSSSFMRVSRGKSMPRHPHAQGWPASADGVAAALPSHCPGARYRRGRRRRRTQPPPAQSTSGRLPFLASDAACRPPRAASSPFSLLGGSRFM